MVNRVEIQVKAEHNKMRLEDLLLGHFSSLSKMYLREVVKNADCEVNGRHENIGYRLRPNDFVEVTVDSTRGTAMRPENIDLDIVFEDDELIVVNKPAGMLVHPSHRENSGTMLNALVYYLNNEALAADSKAEPPALAGGKDADSESTLVNAMTSTKPMFVPPAYAGGSAAIIRPGLPHRLDKDTSGLIVVTKTARAHRIISGHFMKKRVEKRYLALVEGIVHEGHGTIEAPIGRFADLKLWGVHEDGKHSESRFKVRERYADTTLLELEPVTGRTNQLRIHCQLIGHPIVGDTQRGGREFERLCLHAFKLAFPHPLTREVVAFEIGSPAEFAAV